MGRNEFSSKHIFDLFFVKTQVFVLPPSACLALSTSAIIASAIEDAILLLSISLFGFQELSTDESIVFHVLLGDTKCKLHLLAARIFSMSLAIALTTVF